MGNSFGKASTFPYRAVHILKIREHIDNPRDTNCTIMVWLSTLPHARSCTKKHVFNTACGRFWTIEHVNLMVRHRCPANGIVLESPVLQAALAAINGAGNMVTFMRQVTSGFSLTGIIMPRMMGANKMKVIVKAQRMGSFASAHCIANNTSLKMSA
jgi:hypothetical protein